MNKLKHKYLLVAINTGIQQLPEVFEDAKSIFDIAKFYDYHYIKKGMLQNFIDDVVKKVPEVKLIETFNTTGIAVERDRYHIVLGDVFKVMREHKLTQKFELKDIEFQNETYKSFVQNIYQYEPLAYSTVLNALPLYETQQAKNNENEFEQ